MEELKKVNEKLQEVSAEYDDCKIDHHTKLMRLEKILDLVKSDGIWDYDSYTHGLLNGIMLAYSITTDSSYNPYEPPKKWKRPGMFKRIFNKLTPKIRRG